MGTMSIKVTQADKALFIRVADKADHDDEIMEGHHFTWEVAEIARHRQQAVAAEVAQIVAWLRSDEEGEWMVADAIERGDYKETSGE